MKVTFQSDPFPGSYINPSRPPGARPARYPLTEKEPGPAPQLEENPQFKRAEGRGGVTKSKKNYVIFK